MYPDQESIKKAHATLSAARGLRLGSRVRFAYQFTDYQYDCGLSFSSVSDVFGQEGRIVEDCGAKDGIPRVAFDDGGDRYLPWFCLELLDSKPDTVTVTVGDQRFEVKKNSAAEVMKVLKAVTQD